MLAKNDAAISSTLHSPSSFLPPHHQDSLGYKSSISNTSQSDYDQYPHAYSFSTFNRSTQQQPFSITLIIKQSTYEIQCKSAFAFKRQLLKIFSVCGLNKMTRVSLQMLLVNRIVEFNPSFYQLLAECMQEYQKQRESAMLIYNLQ